ncbi:MAG: hypothetical protein ABSB19_19510 [Methylomonas sp.]|jgi:hypothetical protein
MGFTLETIYHDAEINFYPDRVFFSLSVFAENVTGISNEQLQSLQKNQHALAIDIRIKAEFYPGLIPVIP